MISNIGVRFCSICRKRFWSTSNDEEICFPCSYLVEQEKSKGKKIDPIVIRSQLTKQVKQEIGYVYVMKSGNYYKIGMTLRTSRRLNQIKILFPVLKLICHIACRDANKVESYLHKKYRKQKITHEWYHLTKEDLKWFRSLKDHDLDEYPS